jgi:hypothetical protein
MSMNLEQIDALRERADVSYESAREALELSNGDMLEALIYLEKQNKIKTDKKDYNNGASFGDTVKELIKKGNETKVVIKKDENTVLNVPVNAAILTTVLAAPAVIVGTAAAFLTKHSIKVQKPDGSDSEINKVFDQMSEVVNTAAEKVQEKINRDEKKDE